MDVNKLGNKLQGLKEQHMRGSRDVIFIQETHLFKEEQDSATRHHVAMWGFKLHKADEYSFWASGTDSRAGVAILVNLYGVVKKMQAWRREEWSEHLIMTMGKLAGRSILFINIYAPVNGTVRAKFFRQLLTFELPEDCDIICGGDFNCVLERRRDRISNMRASDVGAKDLERLIEKWSLVDAGDYHGSETREEETERQAHAMMHHTHFHKGVGGKSGSSRLDRFYVSATCSRYVRGLETEEGLCRSDHRAVLLELHSSDGAVRLKKRSKLYPPPRFVMEATRSLNEQMLTDFYQRTDAMKIGDTIARWRGLKDKIKGAMKKLTIEARRRTSQGFRQKIKRIKSSMKRMNSEAEQSVTRTQLLEALHQVQVIRQFYTRICNKYGTNNILELTPTVKGKRRGVHDKANILKDSWEEILNGSAAADKGTIRNFVAKYRKNWTVVDMSDLDDEITEAEVRAAIAACKVGKACGPDGLGNEWYKDHCEEMAPILTKLFNECMQEGHTPSCFLEAFIFSISKGGDHKNPRNYRPIALLNSDYKILTRILAWRVRKYIVRIVNYRQCGFVPGRTIHEVIDTFEAAKQLCRANEELTAAQVLMLDFAKAYDSLDRRFLMEVLAAKGFPPKILKIIQSTHENTTVQFLANGFLSENVEVKSGIRQGCPLAPLLFILAVDLLYDVIEGDKRLTGIPLGAHSSLPMLKVAGYADDTAIYIAHKCMQRTAIQLVDQFLVVSGLRLNVQKSAAITLGSASTEGETRTTCRNEGEDSQELNQQVIAPTTTSVRYLGHTAASGNTVTEAWTKAFAALRVRLALAEVKMNTVQQRAEIAAAIIVPKLLYVARHAWPTTKLANRADKLIKNFVWRSTFTEPERVPPGWIQNAVAEQKTIKGGLGVPNIVKELMALSATVVGEWALTARPQLQVIGDILQVRDRGSCEPLMPGDRATRSGVGLTLWETGRAWAETYFHECSGPNEDSPQELEELRAVLRRSNGVTTTWTTEGLVITCTGTARDGLLARIKRRRQEGGELDVSAVAEVELKSLWISDGFGKQEKWQQYTQLFPVTKGVRVGQVIEFEAEVNGVVRFRPDPHAANAQSTRTPIPGRVPMSAEELSRTSGSTHGRQPTQCLAQNRRPPPCI